MTIHYKTLSVWEGIFICVIRQITFHLQLDGLAILQSCRCYHPAKQIGKGQMPNPENKKKAKRKLVQKDSCDHPYSHSINSINVIISENQLYAGHFPQPKNWHVRPCWALYQCPPI